MTTAEELLPCPFCDNKVEWEYNEFNDDGTGYIKCYNCHIEMKDNSLDRDAIESRWNNRRFIHGKEIRDKIESMIEEYGEESNKGQALTELLIFIKEK